MREHLSVLPPADHESLDEASMNRGPNGYARRMKKKQLKRELRALAESHQELERAHRQLAAHAEVIAVAVHSPAIVPASDLEDAIAGIHELTATFAAKKRPRRVPVAA